MTCSFVTYFWHNLISDLIFCYVNILIKSIFSSTTNCKICMKSICNDIIDVAAADANYYFIL